MELVEHYLSLQGEGLHSGQPTYFVRFARCNLRCTWCDSSYTFPPGCDVPLNKVLQAIRKSRTARVCLTGGEPLLHTPDCLALIRKLPKIHFDIETGGSLPIRPVQLPNTSVILDWKLSSSSMNNRMDPENLKTLRPRQDLLKCVTDFSPAEKKQVRELLQETQKLRFSISLQPVWGTDPTPLAEWIVQQKNPRLRINLQLHRILWPNQHRGV